MSRVNLTSIDDDFLSNLPDDIRDEILLQTLHKLPAEALIKLISLSKQFKSLIRNPQFIEAHLSSFSSTETGPKQYYLVSSGYCRVFVSNSLSDSSLNSIEVPFKLPQQYAVEYPTLKSNAVRGVVLLTEVQGYLGKLILWNPSIGKFRMVPCTTDFTMYTAYGFGFDHVNVDFKVVQIVYSRRNGTIEVEHVMVYQVKSGRWKSVATKVHCHVPKYNKCVHVNGTVYWRAFKISRDVYAPRILGFDVVSEVFKVVELPPTPYPFLDTTTLLTTSSDGKSLAYFGGCTPCSNNTRWSVWYLSSSSSKDSIWEKRYDISGADSFRPVCILDDDSGAVFVQFLGKGSVTGIVNGVKEEGAACSAATQVNLSNSVKFPSVFGITSYTPSLAFLLE